MNKAVWIIAATLIGSSVVAATPSSAQVEVGIGPHGPSVRVGTPEHRYERRYIERRHIYNDDDRFVTGSVGRCRTVVTREVNDDGDTVTRRVRRCR